MRILIAGHENSITYILRLLCEHTDTHPIDNTAGSYVCQAGILQSKHTITTLVTSKDSGVPIDDKHINYQYTNAEAIWIISKPENSDALSRLSKLVKDDIHASKQKTFNLPEDSNKLTQTALKNLTRDPCLNRFTGFQRFKRWITQTSQTPQARAAVMIKVTPPPAELQPSV